MNGQAAKQAVFAIVEEEKATSLPIGWIALAGGTLHKRAHGKFGLEVRSKGQRKRKLDGVKFVVLKGELLKEHKPGAIEYSFPGDANLLLLERFAPGYIDLWIG